MLRFMAAEPPLHRSRKASASYSHSECFIDKTVDLWYNYQKGGDVMKKTIIITAVFLLIIIGVLSAYFISTSPKNKGEFCVDDYSEEIEEFSNVNSNNYGNISDWKSAAEVGKIAIEEIFGERAHGSFFKWMGCDVQYDPQKDVYYVRTYRIALIFGGAYDVIMKADGTVLAMWGEK